MGLLIVAGICFGTNITARADNVSGGGTGQGNIGGSNTYKFYYNYDPGQNAIVLTVTTKKAIADFGNTNTHTFTKGDGTVLNTKSPQLGSSLDGALQALINAKGLNMSVDEAKGKLNGLGYWDKGNGVWVCNGGYLTYVEGSRVRPIEHTVSYDLAGGSGYFPNQTKKEGEQMYLHTDPPERLGYAFTHWSSPLGNFNPGDNYTHDQDGGTITLTAQWIDVTPPMVDAATGGRVKAIKASPNYWSSGNGTVSIRAYDGQTGINKVTLYRKSSVDANYTYVTHWDEPEGVFDKPYYYTEENEGAYAYRVIITDRAGNQQFEDSAWIYIDKTRPSLNGSSFRGCGELDAPVAKLRNADGSINSEAYGLYTTVQVSDAITNRSVSNIKHIYIKVYDANNPSNVKYYDVGRGSTKKITCSFNGKATEVLQPCNSFVELNIERFNAKGYIIDVTKDFKNILNLKYELHVVDHAGNENVLYGAHNREARLYGTIRRTTPDEDLTSSIAFKGGYKGVLTITTTGWVNQVDVKWPEEIYIGRAEDEKLNQVTMNYNALVHMAPESDPTTDMNGVFLSDKNKVTSPDTNNTTFTRVYQFYFWIPFYMERANNIQESTPYVVDLTAIRPYAYPQKNDGVAKLSVPFTIGDGNIFKRIRSSILY